MGVLAYRLLVGVYPFSAETQEELLDSILYRDPEPREDQKSGLHPNTIRVLFKALAKDPSQRFQSAELFVSALSNTLERAHPGESGGWPRQNAPLNLPPDTLGKRSMRSFFGAGWRHLLGLAEGETLGRQERVALASVALVLIVLSVALLFDALRVTGRVRSLMARGRYQMARDLVEGLRERGHGDVALRLLAGELAYQTGQVQEAVIEMARVMEEAPELLRRDQLGALLIKLFLERPELPDAYRLAHAGLELVEWPKVVEELGVGSPQRSRRLFTLLFRAREFGRAAWLAERLASDLATVLAPAWDRALTPIFLEMRSRALGLALLRAALIRGDLVAAPQLAAALSSFVPDRVLAFSLGDLLVASLRRRPLPEPWLQRLGRLEGWLEGELLSMLSHPDPLLRLGALRVLKRAGRAPGMAEADVLAWRLSEAMELGWSPGLGDQVARLEASGDDLGAKAAFAIARYELWQREFEVAGHWLGVALRADPKIWKTDEVQGLFLALLAKSRGGTKELMSVLTHSDLVSVLWLALLSPDSQLRHRAAEHLKRLSKKEEPETAWLSARAFIEIRAGGAKSLLRTVRILLAEGAPGKAATVSASVRLENSADPADRWLARRLRDMAKEHSLPPSD